MSYHNNPDPKPGQEVVYTEVIGDIENRAKFGKEKYHTYLKTFNGRDALQDVYEELLDTLIYLKQGLMEFDRLSVMLQLHRENAKVTCPETCFCWEIEKLLE